MPILREGELDIISYNAEQTARLGYRLGTLLHAGDVICLSGDMGAGKLCFPAAWARDGERLIRSRVRPLASCISITVIRITPCSYHLDCYRLRGMEDVESIGFDDMIESRGVVVAEWAEIIREALPGERLWIHLRVMDNNRRNFILEAVGARYQTLIDDFRTLTFGV